MKAIILGLSHVDEGDLLDWSHETSVTLWRPLKHLENGDKTVCI